MSDLVQRLRNLFKHGPTVEPSIDTINEAADRIEALETMLQFTGDADYVIANKGLLVAHERVKALEAALQEILGMSPGYLNIVAKKIARKALHGDEL